MKKHQTKGMLMVLVLALVLGLATSGFPESEWRIESVTLSVGKEFRPPVRELFGEEDWVNIINEAMQDYETFVVDELGGDVTTKMAKEPPGAWNFGAGVQVQTPWAFKLLAGGMFARTKANWRQNAIYHGVFDQEIRTEYEGNVDHKIETELEGDIRASILMICLGPEWCVWRWAWGELWASLQLNYVLGKIFYAERFRLEDDGVYGRTSDASLEGSGPGWQARVKIKSAIPDLQPYRLIIGGGPWPQERKLEGNMTCKEDGSTKIHSERGTLETDGWYVEVRVEYTF